MKRETALMRFTLTFILIVLPGIVAAQTSTYELKPFVDCVEREFDDAGAATGNFIAYFGYSHSGNQPVSITVNSPRNFFTPIPSPPGQPGTFYPGVHHRVVAVVVPPGHTETWFLSASNYVNASYDENNLCGDGGALNRSITYQGRLTDNGGAANGQYDLRFQLFTSATSGNSRSGAINVEDFSVTNGAFTVQLDFGKIAAFYGAENLFVEIGVRAGNSTGAYTTLTPRQPITTVPQAMRASVANNAFNAFNADRLGGLEKRSFIQNTTTQQPESNFNISGNGIIGGNLNVGSLNVSGGYLQMPLTNGTPPASDCDETTEYGRQKVDAANARMYVCTAAGWKYTALQ